MGDFYNKVMSAGDLDTTDRRKEYERLWFPYLHDTYGFIINPGVSNYPDLSVGNNCTHPVVGYSPDVKWVDVKKTQGRDYIAQCHGKRGSETDDWLRSGLNPSKIALMFIQNTRIVIMRLSNYINFVNVWYLNEEPKYLPLLNKKGDLMGVDGLTKGSKTPFYFVDNAMVDGDLFRIGYGDGDVPIYLLNKDLYPKGQMLLSSYGDSKKLPVNLLSGGGSR